MGFKVSNYSGDNDYTVNCTGDVCVGDQVRFERACFVGSYRKPKFSHHELITGLVVADSYGVDKQQHTFTLVQDDGSKTMIKGRNLYANGVWRKLWPDESARHSALEEKHRRGDIARAYRELRKTLI